MFIDWLDFICSGFLGWILVTIPDQGYTEIELLHLRQMFIDREFLF